MVAFVGNLCTQIYIPMNIYKHLLVFINKIKLTTDKIMSPQIRKILATPQHWPLQIKMIPQYSSDSLSPFIIVEMYMHTVLI